LQKKHEEEETGTSTFKTHAQYAKHTYLQRPAVVIVCLRLPFRTYLLPGFLMSYPWLTSVEEGVVVEVKAGIQNDSHV
jgi:hypothetical protein